MNKKSIRKFNLVGFWRNRDRPSLPMPVPRKEGSYRPSHNLFVKKLLQIQQNKASQVHYKGFSWCRLCECKGSELGGGEYSYKGWKWPSGLFHYIEAHNIRLPKKFVTFILND